MCECMCMCVHAHTFLCKSVCTCGVLVHIGQRSISGFIPQALATLFFETEFLAGLDLTK